MKAKNFLLGVTAGVVGGMAVAAFIAPQSGNDLRTTLKSNTTNCLMVLSLMILITC